MGGAWANFVFWRVVMIGVGCMSFFALSDVLAVHGCNLGVGRAWTRPTRIRILSINMLADLKV